MKKMDEMDKNILLRSQSLGYRTMAALLCIWTLYNCWQTLQNGADYQPLPGLILCCSVCVQSLSQIAIKQKMVAGDEEYAQPNVLLRTILAALVLTVIILSLGTLVLVKG